jgi:uncharacterized membrane-anchored protein
MSASGNPVAPPMNRVPSVTTSFWAVKILATTVGETGADYLATHVGLGTAMTGALMSTLLIVSLFWQFRQARYVPWIYWLTVVLVSVAGTQLTDALTDALGVSLYVSTAAFAAGLAVLLIIWRHKEGTLDIRSIVTRRRESFYWCAILLTFALGTASGDLATEALGLGFRLGVVVFLLAIAATACAWKLGANAVAVFWIAYILTRPLGAALGDLISQSSEYGGLGGGTITTSLIFLALIATLVSVETFRNSSR